VIQIQLKIVSKFGNFHEDFCYRSDPDKDTMGWGENDRGVSFTFGAEVVAKFLHKHDFDLICRAHQVNEIPYKSTLPCVACVAYGIIV